MDYEFRISPYNDPSFVQQISCALEKRAKFIPREKYEKMWKASVNISLYLQKIPVGVSTAYGKVDSIHFFSLDLTVVLYVIMITQIDCYKGPHISRPLPSVRRDSRLP